MGVVDDWLRRGKSIYNTEEGVERSMGDLHSGTSFRVDIVGLPDDIQKELQDAARTAAYAVFMLVPLEGKPDKPEVK